jgi:hypothetical protein
LASTEEVLTGLQAFLKRKGASDVSLETPVAIPFGNDPLMWWLIVCEDGTISFMSEVFNQHVLQRHPSLEKIVGMRVDQLQFRGKHVWRTLNRQMDLYGKENKPNRALIRSKGARYFGNLYELPEWVNLQKHCHRRMFLWILSDYYDDDRHNLAWKVINLSKEELI